MPNSDPYFDQEQRDHSDQLAFLLDNVQRHCESFRGGAAYNRRQAFLFRMMILGLGALTTLLLGLKSNALLKNYEEWFSAFALLISATIPVLAAWDAFFDWRWLWLRNTTAYTELYALRDDICFRVADKGNPIAEDELKKFYDRLKIILNDTNTAWRDKRQRAEDPNPNTANKGN